MLCLPLRALPMWLATIEASRVKPELREKLERYQEAAAVALALLGGAAPSLVSAWTGFELLRWALLALRDARSGIDAVRRLERRRWLGLLLVASMVGRRGRKNRRRSA